MSDVSIGLSKKLAITGNPEVADKTQPLNFNNEKELLEIILSLKEYENILYGAKEIKVFTDHKNLTFKTLSIVHRSIQC